jgi:hypothetical protein
MGLPPGPGLTSFSPPRQLATLTTVADAMLAIATMTAANTTVTTRKRFIVRIS